MSSVPDQFIAGEARIYRIPLDLFPGLTGFAHLVCAPGITALVDTGSGLGDSNEQLAQGLEAVERLFGEACGWDRLTHVVITHGHIDHFGGLPFVRSRSKASVGVHRLDRRVLADYERRLEQMADRLRRFLDSAHVANDEAESLMAMYLFTKNLYASQKVDFTFDGPEAELGPIRVLHVPGHCPGQIVMAVGPIALTSDHVLPDVTPHMAPASLARHTGLAAYLGSLDRLLEWHTGPGPALGGHGNPMPDLPRRVDEIRRHHDERLERVLAELDEPRTIAELADRLFPAARGYHRLLAIEEVGAHVEHLMRRKRLEAGAGAARNGRILRFRRRGEATERTRARKGRSASGG